MRENTISGVSYQGICPSRFVSRRRNRKAQKRSQEALRKWLSTALGEGGLGQASTCTVMLTPGAAEAIQRVNSQPTAPPRPWQRRAIYERAFSHSVLAVRCQCWKLSSHERSKNTLRPPWSHLSFPSRSQHTHTAVRLLHSVIRRCCPATH